MTLVDLDEFAAATRSSEEYTADVVRSQQAINGKTASEKSAGEKFKLFA